MTTTKNLAKVIRRKLALDPDLAAAVDAERFNMNVGSVIYEARTQAGLTQQQLAERVGMCQSAIARLEDADYDGHSLKTLERIAFALGKRLEVAFVGPTASEVEAVTVSVDVPAPEWEDDLGSWQPTITTELPDPMPRNGSAVA